MDKITLSEDMEVWYFKEREAKGLYSEIFKERTYVPRGIELDSGSTVFDVGANIGLASIFFALEYGAKVYSFEPLPDLYEVLEANFKEFSILGKTFRVAISSHDHAAEIEYYPNFPGISGLYGELTEMPKLFSDLLSESNELPAADVDRVVSSMFKAEQVACDCWSLSTAIREADVAHIDLLKVDVEHSELDVLYGLESSDWNKIDRVIAEVHYTNDRVTEMSSLLSSNGFQVCVDELNSIGYPKFRACMLTASRTAS